MNWDAQMQANARLPFRIHMYDVNPEQAMMNALATQHSLVFFEPLRQGPAQARLTTKERAVWSWLALPPSSKEASR